MDIRIDLRIVALIAAITVLPQMAAQSVCSAKNRFGGDAAAGPAGVGLPQCEAQGCGRASATVVGGTGGDGAAVGESTEDKRALQPGAHDERSLWGKNLFGGGGRAYTALDAARDWYSEISKFHYGVLNGSNWYASGHYTQMVWRNTTQVGMGQAVCSDGSIVIVAEYDPPGNYMGQKPY